MGSYKKCLLLALSTSLVLSLGVTQAASFVDVLDQPARLSALAVRSPLLATVRTGDRLVAVGQRGHILYSDDSGKSWLQASVPVSADLNAVSFPTQQQGWAVGSDGVVLHSSDAGATWSKQLDGRQIGDLLVKYYGTLVQAEPGNEQWPRLLEDGRRLTKEGADKPLLDVWFANDQLGYVVGVFNLILRTEDGGKHWTPFQDRTDNPQGLHLNAIAATGDALYIVGEQGLLLKFDDVQQRFLAVPTPYQGSFFGVIGKPGEVLAYGLRGHVFRSTDSGANWTSLNTGLQVNITTATLDTKGHYELFTQAGHRLVSQDGGQGLKLMAQQNLSPVAGAVQAADGALVLVGNRGARVLSQE